MRFCASSTPPLSGIHFTPAVIISKIQRFGDLKKRFDEHAAGYKHAAQKSMWPVTSMRPVTSMQVKSRRN